MLFRSEVTFSKFFADICNTTPATSEHIKKALLDLSNSKILTVMGPGDRSRRTAGGIDNDDKIIIKPQRKFNFPFWPTKK